MCVVTDKIKFCTCLSSTTDKLKHYWILHRYNKSKNEMIIGEPISPSTFSLNYDINKAALVNRINEILELHPDIEQVFVSTDDNEVINDLKNSLSKPIIYYEDMFRADSLNPHTDPYDRYNSSREFHKYKLALEGILEIFTLTKCDYMLKADVSALSMVATILSENIKKVYKV
jgi:hypothetical protein